MSVVYLLFCGFVDFVWFLRCGLALLGVCLLTSDYVCLLLIFAFGLGLLLCCVFGLLFIVVCLLVFSFAFIVFVRVWIVCFGLVGLVPVVCAVFVGFGFLCCLLCPLLFELN